MRAPFRLAMASAVLAAGSQALAIVATSTSTVNPIDTTYSWVGQMNGSSAVAVGSNKVLTARHVGGGDFVLNGVTYTIASSVNAPQYTIGAGDTTNVDLTLVTINGTLPGWYNVAGAGSLQTDDTITMVGFGRSGVVNGSNNGYTINVDSGSRRKGDNIIDVFATIDVDDSTGQAVGGGGPVLISYLDAAGEAAVAVNDSGGGWFEGSSLVGISSFVFNDTQNNAVDPVKYPNYGFASRNTGGFDSLVDTPNYTGEPYTIDPGEAYFGSGAIDLTDPQIQDWLISQGVTPVPEPTSMVVLGLGALAMLRRRRSR